MFKYLLLALCLSVTQAINECGQYGDCLSCLNITAGHTTGGRKNCGWCHTNINYQNGTAGKKCADIRDDPFNCGDQFDTFKCSAGWVCDPIHGKCIVGKPGEGYSLNSTCNQICNIHPHPGDDKTWKCNITSYTCQECDPKDTTCVKERSAACNNCKPDPQQKFKCDKTDPKNPQCKKCPMGKEEPGCEEHTAACQACVKPQDKFHCNNQTLKCEKTTSTGFSNDTCNQECGHVTPTQLIGTWRGLMVKNKMTGMFDMGEYDMKWGENNLTVTYPNRTTNIYDVFSLGPGKVRLSKDGQNYTIVYQTLSNLKHTISIGISTYGHEAPNSFKEGMNSERALNVVMWKCTSWSSTQCKFDHLTLDIAGKRKLAALPNQPNLRGDGDVCNKYADCHQCITANEGGIKCGWCLGGTLDYKGIGPTSFKCGGFKAGTPYAFTCPVDFRTVDCKGYACDIATKKCSVSDDGQFPDLMSCSQICNIPIPYAKCNFKTKKCEDSCKAGTPGCYNKDYCNIFCEAPKSKCNAGTGKCEDCDQTTDPDCTILKTDCAQTCKPQTLAKCNKETGHCEDCKEGSGCIPKSSCELQCSPPPPGYKCNWSAKPKPKCEQQKSGGMDEDKCKEQCDQPQFQKCNYQNNTCDNCERGKDPKCIYPAAFCEAQKAAGRCKVNQLDGLYRQIEVNMKYKKGEYDLLFKDKKLYMQFFDTKVETKELGDVQTDGITDDGMVMFTVANWKQDPNIWPFDTLHGVYKETFGQENIFKFLEIAFGKDKIEKLDDGLDGTNGRYWVGVKCANKQNCDFSKASPEKLTQTPAYITEFDELEFMQ